MIKKEMEPGEIERRVHDLANAMNKIRSAQAERDDVVVEMKHTKVSRLELLFEDLQSVIEDIPADNDHFEFAVTKGEKPRLWIDMTTFVRMGTDGREYEIVKDTRMGRVILGHGNSRKKIGEHVTAYIAERLLERERMIEGDWLSLPQMLDARPSPEDQKLAIENARATELEAPAEKAASKGQHSTFALFIWFVLGLIGGAGILFGLVWFGLMEQIVQLAR
jgi:hypothetical protein